MEASAAVPNGAGSSGGAPLVPRPPSQPRREEVGAQGIRTHLALALQPLQESIKDLQAEVQRVARSGATTNARVDAEAEKVEQHYQEFLELRSGSAKVGSTLEKLQADAARTIREKSRLEADHEVTKADLSRATEQLRNSSATWEAAFQRLEALDCDVRKLRGESMEGGRGLRDHVESTAKLHNMCELLNDRHTDMVRGLGNVTRSNADLQKAVKELRKDRDETELERQADRVQFQGTDRLADRLDNLEREFGDHYQEAQAVPDELKVLAERVKVVEEAAAADRRKELEKRLEELRSSHDRAAAEIARSSERMDELDSGVSSFRTELQVEKAKHAGLQKHVADEVQKLRAFEEQQGIQNDQSSQDIAGLTKKVHDMSAVTESVLLARGNQPSLGTRLDMTDKSVGFNGTRIERLQKDLLELRERLWEEEHKQESVEQKAAIALIPALEQRLAENEKGVHETSVQVTEDVGCLRAEINQLHDAAAAGAAQKPRGLPIFAGASSGVSPDLQNNFLEARVDQLERQLQEARDRHSEGVRTLEDSHRALGAKHDAARSRHARELEVLKANHEGHAHKVSSLRDVESSNSDMFLRQAEELSRAQTKIDALAERCKSLEAETVAQERFKREFEAASGKQQELELRQGHLEEHSKGLQGKAAAAADRATKFAELAEARADKMQGVLDEYARTRGRPGDLEQALDAHKDSVEERLKGVQLHYEHMKDQVDRMGDNVQQAHEENIRAVDGVHAAHARLREEVVSPDGLRQKQASAQIDAADAIKKRLNHNEKLLSELVQRHAEHLKGLEKQELAGTRLAGEVEAGSAQRAAVAERVAALEKKIGDDVGLRMQDLASAKARLNQLEKRLGDEREFRNTLGQDVALLRQEHADVASNAQAREVKVASLLDRMQQLEGSYENTADQQEKELDKIKTTSAKLSGVLHEQEKSAEGFQERLKRLEASTESTLCETSGKHLSMVDRFVKLETDQRDLFAATQSQAEEIKSTQTSNADDFAEVRRTLTSLASHDHVETRFGEMAETRAQDSAATDLKVENLCSKVAEATQARTTLSGRLAHLEEMDAHMRTVDVHIDSLQEKVASLEQRHGKELEELHLQGKNLRQQHQDGLAAVKEERAQVLDSHMAAVEASLAKEAKARETNEAKMQENFNKEREARQRHATHLQELLTMERESREKQRDVHHSHLLRESQAREAAHRDFEEMVGTERALRQHQDDNQQEILKRETKVRQDLQDQLGAFSQGLEGKLATLVTRLGIVEEGQTRHGDQLGKAERFADSMRELQGEQALEKDVKSLKSSQRETTTKIELQGVQAKKAADVLHNIEAEIRGAQVEIGQMREEVGFATSGVSKLELRYDACQRQVQNLYKGFQHTQVHEPSYSPAKSSPRGPRIPAMLPDILGSTGST